MLRKYLAVATVAVTMTATQALGTDEYLNILLNPGFDRPFQNDGLGLYWSINAPDPNDAGYVISEEDEGGNSRQSISVTSLPPGAGVRLQQAGLSIRRDQSYRLSFDADWNGSVTPTLDLRLVVNGLSTRTETCNLQNTWSCQVDFAADDPNDPTPYTGWMGIVLRSEGTLSVDNVKLENTNRPAYQQDVWIGSGGVDTGLDPNDVTESTPWATLEPLSNYDLLPGSTVYLERGGQYRVWRSDTQGSRYAGYSTPLRAFSGVTYSAYGTGEPPVVLASIELDENDWQKLTGVGEENLWQSVYAIPYQPDDNFQGYPHFLLFGDEKPENVGIALECGEPKIGEDLPCPDMNSDVSIKSFYRQYLDRELEFYLYEDPADPGFARVIVNTGPNNEDNPATKYSIDDPARKVEMAYAHSAFDVANVENVTVSDITFKHAKVYNVRTGNADNLEFSNISSLYGGANIKRFDAQEAAAAGVPRGRRSGACFYIHNWSYDVTVRDSQLSQCLDQAIGVEAVGAEDPEISRIDLVDNDISYAGGGIGVKSQNPDNASITDVLVKGNHISMSGYGWSENYNALQGKSLLIMEKSTGIEGDPVPHVEATFDNNVVDTFRWTGFIAWRGQFNFVNNIVRNGRGEAVEQAMYPSGIIISGNHHPTQMYNDAKAVGLVANNLVYNNQGYEISVRRNNPDPAAATDSTLTIVNNLFYDNVDTPDQVEGESRSGLLIESSNNLSFRNNIVYTNGTPVVEYQPFQYGGSTPELSHNLYFRADADALSGVVWQAGLYALLQAQGDLFYALMDPDFDSTNPSSFYIDPDLFDPAAWNFSCAQCYDLGTLEGLENLSSDIYGNGRMQGAAVDIGPAENVYNSDSVLPDTLAAEDGYVKEQYPGAGVGHYAGPSGKGSSAIRVGIDTDDKQFRGIASLPLGDVPTGANLQGVHLRFTQGTSQNLADLDKLPPVYVEVTLGFLGNSDVLTGDDYQAVASSCKPSLLRYDAEGNFVSALSAECVSAIQAFAATAITSDRLQFRLTSSFESGQGHIGFWSTENVQDKVEISPHLSFSFVPACYFARNIDHRNAVPPRAESRPGGGTFALGSGDQIGGNGEWALETALQETYLGHWEHINSCPE